MSTPSPHIFVATRREDVPAGCVRYVSVDGSVPGAAVTWDHHRTGERINLDAMPSRVSLDGLDGIGTTLADTDAVASVVVAVLGGASAIGPGALAVLRSASHWCDHLAGDPSADDETNARGRGVHHHVSRELARGGGGSDAFARVCRDLVERVARGTSLPEAPAPEPIDLTGILSERGRVALVDVRGRGGVPPNEVYAQTRCPVAVFVGDHPRGGLRYTVGVNPLAPDAPADLGAALRALARAEFELGPPVVGPDPVPESENWGGRATVFGSPWNHGSRLGVDRVVALVADAIGRRWLLNAFSLNLLGDAADVGLRVRRVDVDEARRLAAEVTSAVGHAETAAMFADALGVPVELQRATVTLEAGDEALVGQYRGPRLAEGATRLPPGSEVRWYVVRVAP